MSVKSYFIKTKKLFGACLLSLAVLSPIAYQLLAQAETQINKTVTTVTSTVSQGTTLTSTSNGVVAEPEKPVYYELVQDNLKPDPDEFYVNSIFDIQGKPKASIARSQNKRAGDLYDSYVTCGIGDYIADGLRIDYIDPRLKEIIVVRDATQEYYVLTMSYGTATSRLVRIKNYKPKTLKTP